MDACWWLPTDAAEARADERSELDRLRAENANLRGRLDALQGERDAARRATADAYERGKRDGERLRGLPSILAGLSRG